MASQLIELDKISPSAIPLIRPLKPTDSEEYRKLAASIQRDGQKSPILVRRLTDKELATVAEGVEFGIIDGHHRYDIAKNTDGATTIEASIMDTQGSNIDLDVDEDVKSYLRDVMTSFHLNDTNIQMTPLEKGAIIRQVVDVTGFKVDVVGNLLFNLKTAMAYRCVQTYEKSIESQPVAQETPAVSLPYSQKDFTALLKSVPKSEKDIDLSNAEAAGKQLHAIRKLEEQLKALKKILSASDDVKKTANQLGVEERRKNKENNPAALIDAAKKEFEQKDLQDWAKGKRFEELRSSTKATKAELMEQLGITQREVTKWEKALKEYNQFMKALEAKKAEIDASDPLDNLEKATIIASFDESSATKYGIKSVGDTIFGKKNWPEDYQDIYSKHLLNEIISTTQHHEGDIDELVNLLKPIMEKYEKLGYWDDDDADKIAEAFYSVSDSGLPMGSTILHEVVRFGNALYLTLFHLLEDKDEIRRYREDIEETRIDVEEKGEENLSEKDKQTLLFETLDATYTDVQKVDEVAKAIFPSLCKGDHTAKLKKYQEGYKRHLKERNRKYH